MTITEYLNIEYLNMGYIIMNLSSCYVYDSSNEQTFECLVE